MMEKERRQAEEVFIRAAARAVETDPVLVRSALSLRPCGREDSASRKRHHWSNVIKAASYLHGQLCRDTFIRKERGDKSMM